MGEQLGKPNNIPTEIQKVPEKIPRKDALADLLQRRKTELRKTEPQIAEELSKIFGYKVGKTSVTQWSHRYDPHFPEESKLQAIAEVYELSLSEVELARQEGLTARGKLTDSRKSPKVQKPDRENDVYGGGSMSRAHRAGRS